MINKKYYEWYNDYGCFRVVLRNNGEQVSEHQSEHQFLIEKYQEVLLDYFKYSRTYVSINIIKPLIDRGLLDYVDKKNIRSKIYYN